MNSSTYLNWFRRLLLLGAVVAGMVASAAGAVSRPPDVQDASAALYATQQGQKADGLRLQGIANAYQQLRSAQSVPTVQGLRADGLRLQGIAQVYKQIQPVASPDAFERYAVAHPYGSGLAASSISRPPDVRDTAAALGTSGPDVLERFATAHPYGAGLSSTPTVISRPPDVNDAALAVQSGSFIQSSVFHWGDWAIGIGTGMGLILLLAGGLVMGRRQVRHGVQTA